MDDDSRVAPGASGSGELSHDLAFPQFKYGDRQLRVILIDDEPRFVAADICAILGIGDVRQAVERLDEADRCLAPIRSGNQNRKMWVVNESGLYDLIIRSDKPEARAFRRWITSEVLPAIRKTGQYSIPRQLPRSYADALRELAGEVEAREAAEAKVVEMTPKVEAYDTFLNAEGVYLIGTVAKMLDIGPNILFARLRDEHILISGGRRHNTPYQQYMKHFRVVAREIDNGDRVMSGFTTYVKPEGVDWIRKVLRLQEALPVT